MIISADARRHFRDSITDSPQPSQGRGSAQGQLHDIHPSAQQSLGSRHRIRHLVDHQYGDHLRSGYFFPQFRVQTNTHSPEDFIDKTLSQIPEK